MANPGRSMNGLRLRLDDSLVPPTLEVIDRVRRMPGKQRAKMPELRAAVAGLVDQLEVGHAVVPGIADVHVKQHPRHIALDRIARLEAVGVAPGGAIREPQTSA